ncbi:MAG TPA: hypothetical protein VLF88_02210 [Candidatus Babeliales bacterium]|nr:hypothetical protein [Candidatus Babeliales bacterium]
MDEETAYQKANELVCQLYGVGSPVSDEEVRVLIAGRRRQRITLALQLVGISELSGFSPTELVEMLDFDLRAPHAYVEYARYFKRACKVFCKKGYGSEIQRVLTTDGMFGRQGNEPFLSPASLIRSRDVSGLDDLIFNLPPKE